MAERTKLHSAYDGQIVFEMATRETVRSRAVLADLIGATPEFDLWEEGSVMRRYFSNFGVFFGACRKITFQLNGHHEPLLEEFKAWWEDVPPAVRSSQYRAIWESYQDLPSEINDLIVKAHNETRDDLPPAPEELQPGAEERATADPNSQDGGGRKSRKLNTSLSPLPSN